MSAAPLRLVLLVVLFLCSAVVVLLITCDKIRVDLVNSFSAGIRGHKNKPSPVFRNETVAPLYYYHRYSAVFHFADQNSHDRS